jgi:hypothetical protein
MKTNKKRYLKERVENFLTGIVLLSIAFVAMTIDSIGNNTYNIILIVIMITNVIIMKILTKFGRSYQD